MIGRSKAKWSHQQSFEFLQVPWTIGEISCARFDRRDAMACTSFDKWLSKLVSAAAGLVTLAAALANRPTAIAASRSFVVRPSACAEVNFVLNRAAPPSSFQTTVQL